MNKNLSTVITIGNAITINTNNVTIGIAIFCTGNTVVNFATAYDGCDASADNLTLP